MNQEEDKELWKDIKGYEGYYKISTKFRVRSIDRLVNSKNKDIKARKRGKLLTPVCTKYTITKRIILSKENVCSAFSLNDLMTRNFLGITIKEYRHMFGKGEVNIFLPKNMSGIKVIQKTPIQKRPINIFNSVIQASAFLNINAYDILDACEAKYNNKKILNNFYFNFYENN